MSKLDQLYQEMILEHNKSPRNFGEIPHCTHQAHGVNPLCGDDYHVFINLDQGRIQDIGFLGQGCAISKSSGSLMTQAVKGKTLQEAQTLKSQFLDLLLTQNQPDPALGKLKVFEGVKKYPIRVKCASLVWRAFESALSDAHDVTTE